MDQPLQQFDFINLPSEMRLAVYRLFFSGHPKLITYVYRRPYNFISDRHWKLLLVSKTIYAEALPEYYRTCLFDLCTLDSRAMQKLLKEKADSNFARYASHFLMWKVPDHGIFDVLQQIKWVKLRGIACGVEPDPVNGQAFTHASLMAALRRSRIPGFTWNRCLELCRKYSDVNFMIDLRCDYCEVKLDADGHPMRKWITQNFVYDIKADTFVEELLWSYKQDGLVLRPQGSDEPVDKEHVMSRVFLS